MVILVFQKTNLFNNQLSNIYDNILNLNNRYLKLIGIWQKGAIFGVFNKMFDALSTCERVVIHDCTLYINQKKVQLRNSIYDLQ